MRIVLVSTACLLFALTGIAQQQKQGGRFAKADANGDGVIDSDEFRGKADQFAKLDGDSDGALTKEEMQAGRKARRPGRFAKRDANGDGVLTADEFDGNPERFAKIDADADGSVTVEEMGAARRARQANAGQRRLAKADANGDGVISADEFKGKPERFAKLDTDVDGSLTPEEMTAARKARAVTIDGQGDRVKVRRAPAARAVKAVPLIEE